MHSHVTGNRASKITSYSAALAEIVTDELRREEGEVRVERGEWDTGVVVSFQSCTLARVAYSTFCASMILLKIRILTMN